MSWWLNPFLRGTPAPGMYFYRHQIGSFQKPPKGCRSFGACWFGMDGTKGAQPICHVVADVDSKRRLHITECYHKVIPLDRAVQWMFSIHEGMHRATVEGTAYPKRDDIYGVRQWFVTPQQFDNGVDDMVFEEERRRKNVHRPIRVPVTPLPNPFDLDSSARRLQSELIERRVILPEKDLWVPDFLAELCEWPCVRTDARVRAMCVLAAAIPEISPPAKAEAVHQQKGSAWAA